MRIEFPPNTTLLTGNPRLADHLRRQYDKAQQAAGQHVWESLNSLPLRDWLVSHYQDALLLNAAQALTLWEDIIADSLMDEEGALALLTPRTLAKTARDAWLTLQEWEIPLTTLQFSSGQETQLFYRWAMAFERLCQHHHWLDADACTRPIIAQFDAIKHIPSHIMLAGFTEISPQTQRLFDLLAAHSQVQTYQPIIQDNTQYRIGLADEEQELMAQAHWAKELWQQNKALSIACVIPNLSTVRDDVARVFANVFDDSAAFNISGGTALQRFPMIQAALDVLTLTAVDVDAALLSHLLRTPFSGGAEQELSARAALDVILRTKKEPRFYWQSVLSQAKTADCHVWAQHCQQLLAILPKDHHRQSASLWAQQFSAQLQAIGWPGERSLNSAEYQQLQRWQSLLLELSQLDVVHHTPLSYQQALNALTNLAKDTLFQPQTEFAPVQVLGLLESSGLTFDYLWVSGMTEEDWPKAAAPNPFIPLALQRKHAMPHASAERELDFSRLFTARLKESATQVIFSYARQKQDRPQSPSALIRDIPEQPTISVGAQWSVNGDHTLRHPAACPRDPDKASIETGSRGQAAGRRGEERTVTVNDEQAMEYLSDEIAPAFLPTETLRGGASVFKHQAACPFRAFAKIRLGAQELAGSEPYITPQERGMYLHDVLENVWRQLQDQKNLREYTDADLKIRVQSAIDQVLQTQAKQRPFTLQPRYQRLERERLTTLVLTWLNMEKQRPDFRVLTLESQRELQFAGLKLTFRLDREDELADGERVVIDYKTGACNTADWFGERPNDPQLPLYGMSTEQPAQGLMFAQLTADKLQFKGISAEDYGISGVETIAQQKYDTTITQWSDFYAQQAVTLTRLAQEFQAGDAKVDPKQGQQTCRYCDLKPLCRVGEVQPVSSVEAMASIHKIEGVS